MKMKKISLILILAFVSVVLVAQHKQNPLPYAYDALEPFFDKETMEIHYSKHHAAYVANLNKAIVGTEFEKLDIDNLQAKIDKNTPMAIRNNGGGHWNHAFFWEILSPKANMEIPKNLLTAIEKSFGSFDKFKAEFKSAAVSRFGSGWAWLIVKDGKLLVTSSPNQDNPLMQVSDIQGVPILGLDVWEHAYYLKYQNRRADFIDAFFNIVDWNKVAKLYDETK
ncbi:MAG: superoxide dismutase [Bacteroidales bacterium]|nr:superoxide dismutase [Bacteroidales bacterium]